MTFLIWKQTLPNVATFSKIYRQQFDMSRHCPRDLTLPWQPYFHRHFFKISIYFIWKINKSFLVACVKGFRSFIVFIRFYYFWADFGRFFEDVDNPRWRTKMAPFRNDHAIIKSCGVNTSKQCGRQRRHLRHTIYPPSLFVVAFSFLSSESYFLSSETSRTFFVRFVL